MYDLDNRQHTRLKHRKPLHLALELWLSSFPQPYGLKVLYLPLISVLAHLGLFCLFYLTS